MRTLKLLIVPFITLLVIMGCQTDYNGNVIPNQSPDIAFNTYSDTAMYLTKKKVRIGWHCNDQDGLTTKFFYAVSSKMSINASNALDSIPASKWIMTSKSYADIAFPFDGDSIKTYANPDTTKPDIKYVFSRVYVYAVDEDGNKTGMISRGFWRTNTKPERPRVECPSFLWDAEHLPPVTSFEFADFQPTIIPRVFLREKTNFWDPVVFRWTSDDADSEVGDKVDLEFKWELRKIITSVDLTEDQMQNSSYILSLPDSLVLNSGDWNKERTSVTLDDEVFNAGIGYFKFIVRVRDDGNEESASPCVSFFEAFRPVFDKGILVIDRTNDLAGNDLKMGNPSKTAVTNFFKSGMEYCGFSEDNSNLLKRYEYYGDNSKLPNMKKLAQYRLLILVDEDKKAKSDMFMDNTETQFGVSIRQYLLMGGKVLVTGNSPLVDITGTNYVVPEKSVPKSKVMINNFGISAVTCGEGFEVTRGKFYKNYDFVGTKVFSHVQDSLFEMKVDPVKMNTYWKNFKVLPISPTVSSYGIKANGIFLPGVSTIKVNAGEILMGYKSSYDDPQMANVDSLINAGGYKNGVANDSAQYRSIVLNRNRFDGLIEGQYSALATRYMPNNDLYRSAYIGLPLFFMDNANNVVYRNIRTMINWFDLTQIPSSMRITKK